MRVSEFIAQNPGKKLTATKIRSACTALKIDPDDIQSGDVDRILDYVANKSNKKPASQPTKGNLTIINPNQVAIEQAFAKGCDTGEAEGEEAAQLIETAYEIGRKKAFTQRVNEAIDDLDSKHRLPSSVGRRRIAEQDVMAMLPPGLIADRLGGSDDVIDAEIISQS